MIEVHYMSNMLILYSTYTHTKQTHTHALVFEISLRRNIKNKKKNVEDIHIRLFQKLKE